MTIKITSPIRGLSDTFIRSLKPQSDRYEIADNACSGLRIRINKTGSKSFVWYYKDPSQGMKIKRLTLGRYGTGQDQLTLPAARKALKSAKYKLEGGELDSYTATAPKTVSELCDLFYKDRIAGPQKRRRPEAVLQVINHDIKPVIGSRSISTISTLVVSSVVTKVIGRGATTHAGKVTAILKQLFKFAVSRGFILISPADALDKADLGVVSTIKDRWLPTEEIKPVWIAITSASRLSTPTKTGLKVLMLTGIRTGELLKAEWQHINFEAKEWFIPKENTKTLEAWTVPLTDTVIKLLRELEGLDSTYIFAGRSGALSDKVFGRAIRRLFEKGELTIEPFTPHDFRRTLRTHLESLNIQPHIAEKCLNHSLGKINATYNKNVYATERREALNKWAAFVDHQVNYQTNTIGT